MREGTGLRSLAWVPGILVLTALAGLARSADPARETPSAGRIVQSLPVLELQITGPQETTVSGKVTFELEVKNTGQSRLANLMIVDSFDPGLEHATMAANPIKSKLGDLEPGQSRQVAISFRAKQPGVLSNKVEILLGERVLASASSSVKVKAAEKQPPAANADELKFPEPQGDKIEAQAQAERAKARAERIRKLGAPLVENGDELKRLDPEAPIWIDPKQKCVVLVGLVCKADYPLEFFATTSYPDRAYESVIVVDAKPWLVHGGLLALGAVPGHPTQFTPKFVTATGTEVVVELRWKDAAGKIQTARAQDWIRNTRTKKALDVNWVFAGSRIWVDEKTGEKHYQANGGDFICVLNSPDALLDLPIASASALEARLFESSLERLPPSGTPVTLLLKPLLPAK